MFICNCNDRSIVAIKSEDITLLVTELDLTKENAEELLRKHKGSVQASLKAYISGK